MDEGARLVDCFSRKYKSFEGRIYSCTNSAYLEGVLSSIVGGIEVKDIVDYILDRPGDRKEIAHAVREICSSLYVTSGILDHALRKPYGYPGDFMIMEYIYDYLPHRKTSSNLGVALDEWALSLNLPRAVRARKNALVFLIHDLISRCKGERFNLLSIGSGGARELRELPVHLLQKLDVTLIDRDSQALDFAETELLKVTPDVRISLVNNDFHRVEMDKKFNLIYCFGLFDYLSDKVVVNCFRQFARNLTDSGNFVYCIKNSIQYNDWFYELFADWRFVPRSIIDGARLLEDSDLELANMFSLESDIAAIYMAVKGSTSTL